MTHSLLWKSVRTPASLGANPLLGWQRFEHWSAADKFFKPVGSPGALGPLVGPALEGAVAAGRDVSIAMTSEAPGITPVDEMSDMLMRVRPVTLICPERAERPGTSARWVVARVDGRSSQTPPETVPATAI